MRDDGLVTVHLRLTFVAINTINVRHLGRVIRTVQDAVNTDKLHSELLTQKCNGKSQEIVYVKTKD